MKWFRLYHDMIDDPKIAMMSESEQLLWVRILCLASMSEARGVIMLSDDEIAFRLRISIESWKTAKDKFRCKGLVDPVATDMLKISGWDDRQFESDSSTARVAAHRAKKKGSDGNVTVTLQPSYSNVGCNADETFVTASYTDPDPYSKSDFIDPDPDLLSVQQAETDPVEAGGKKGKSKGTEKTKGVNNRNKSDIYAKLKNPESFESFWDWYQTKLDNIPPDREGKRVKAGSKNKAAEAWKACIEDGNKLDLFREGCRKFDFMGTRGVPHAERFIRNEIYLNGISNGSGADFVALTGASVTEEDRNSWIEEMREKGQKFYRGPGGVIDQERAAFFHEHAYIFEEVA